MKRCVKCHEEKPVCEFSKNRSRADGLSAYCKPCNRAHARAWAAENRERVRRKTADWIAANKDRKRQTDHAYKRANIDRILAEQRERNAAERPSRECARCGQEISKYKTMQARYCSELCRLRDQLHRQALRRRQWLKNQFVEDVAPRTLFRRDDGICGICGDPVDRQDFHVDHIIPVSRGGEHSYANTQIAHPHCNRVKRDRLPDEMAA